MADGNDANIVCDTIARAGPTCARKRLHVILVSDRQWSTKAVEDEEGQSA